MKLLGALARAVTVQFRKNSQLITLRPNQSITYTGTRAVDLPATDGDVTLLGSTGALSAQTVATISSNVTLTDKQIHFVDTAAARSLTLPTPLTTRYMVVLDKTGTGATNNITIVRAGSEKIQGVAASYVMKGDFQQAVFVSDGTDWWDIS